MAGWENFTVTTQTDLTLHDDRAHIDFFSDDLVAHEAAHSWFGNLVTCRSWAHAWLHESFATYLEGLYLRESKGKEEFDFQMLRDAEAYFEEHAATAIAGDQPLRSADGLVRPHGPPGPKTSGASSSRSAPRF